MADVSIDASISTSTARGARSVVFTSALVGYWFYIDSDGTFGYSKTTDGGATWGGQVEIDAATVNIAFDVWFDKWTPGDNGTLIHLWYFDSNPDDVTWRSLDTNGDTLGTERVVFAAGSAVAGRGAFVSGTKARSGYLYCAFDVDAGAERGLHRSTDGGTTWSSDLDDNFVEATIDECLLFPASNTGDNNDIWAVYQDASTDELTLKMWDSSAASASESAEIGASMAEGTTDLNHQRGFSASVRHSDGHLILAVMTAFDASTDHRVYDINGTGSITALTAVQTGTDDHYFPAVFIDQNTDDLYIAYNGKRDGSENLTGSLSSVYYVKSTDDGATWSSGDTAYREAAAGNVFQVWAPLMGQRFYVGWRSSTTLVGNKVNSIVFPHATTGTITGPGTTVAGTAAHIAVHPTSGAITGPGPTVAGTASSATARPSSGALTGPGATLAGTANRTRVHASPGALTGSGATVAGTASSATARPSTGALVGPGATLAGAASSATPRPSSGTLTGPGAVIAGVASSATARPSTGALVGPGATLSGTASSATTRPSTGVLVGPGATVVGTAARSGGGPVEHLTSGVLAGPGATVTGAALRVILSTSIPMSSIVSSKLRVYQKRNR